MQDKQKTLKVFCDTNVLMSNSTQIFDKYKDTNTKIIISGYVLNELDKHKISSDENKKYKARQASRDIEENQDMIEYVVRESNFEYILPFSFDKDNYDNKIIQVLNNLYFSNEEFGKENGIEIFALSNDLLFRQKCKLLGIRCDSFNGNDYKTSYKGHIELILTSDEINKFFDNLSKYNLVENQYVIIHEKDKRKSQEFRYVNGELKRLKLPDSKYIKGKNAQQRCALDLLNNNDIPIKIIAGNYGSGKTHLTTKMGLYHVFEKGNYGSILLLRNPLGSGEEIGFLKGDKQEKIGDFFKCIEQYIDSSITKDKNIDEYIKKDIPFYIKGMSYGSTYVFVEESEDMNLNILKLIGSRIESDSCVVFCGDYKQSEPKYKNNNGLLQLIDKLKGNPLVGIIVLEEDIRSEASKVFVDV